MMLILDDHPLARQGIYSIIQMYKSGAEVLHASTIRESQRIVEESDIQMVFVDLNLGKENGFDFLVWLKEQKKSVKTFIITSSSRQSDFVYAQKLGVDAYVLKDAFLEEIMCGLRVAEQGGRFYSAALVEQLNQVNEDKNVFDALTDREMDIFVLLGQGYSNAKISETLYISEGTTKKHISNILSKLNLRNRVEAVLLANKNSFSVKTAVERSLKENLRKRAHYV